jgi:hypothetical protein
MIYYQHYKKIVTPPLCTLLCVSFLRWITHLFYTLQENVCSPICMNWCTLVPEWFIRHESKNCVSIVCMHSCAFSGHCCLYDLLHTLQENGYSHYACVDLCSNHTLKWMIYYTHWRKMAVPRSIWVDVFSNHSVTWMIYYTHYMKMSVTHSIWVDVSSTLCHLNDLLCTLQENGCSPLYLLWKLCMSWRIFKSLCHLNNLFHITGKSLFPSLHELMYHFVTWTIYYTYYMKKATPHYAWNHIFSKHSVVA